MRKKKKRTDKAKSSLINFVLTDLLVCSVSWEWGGGDHEHALL